MKLQNLKGTTGRFCGRKIEPLAWPRVLSYVGLAILLAGCATTQKKDKGPKYVFFPPAPDAPRLQYLTSYNSDRDMRSGGKDSFITFLTGKQPDYTPILKPYGGATLPGHLYVCDSVGGLVLSLDLAAGRIRAIAPKGPAALKMPLNMAAGSNGWLYIVDGGREQLVIIDEHENLVDTIGEKGKSKPRDVALTADRIYLSDVLSNCVHVLDKRGRTPLFDIPRPEDSTNADHKLYQPINIALDSQGRLYVSDFGAYRVQVYDPDGKYLHSIGKYGDNFGEFARNKGVAVDRENRVYVVDAAGELVQLFDETGRLLMWFGEPSSSRVGLELPAKVVLDYDNVDYYKRFAAPDFALEHLVIVMNQYGPRRVSVFGFGHKK